jgi:hypothetical protein
MAFAGWPENVACQPRLLMDSDDQLIEAIAPDVLKALANKGFFEVLDDQMCPEDPTAARVLCQGALAISTTTLITFGFDRLEIADIHAVLATRGGFCDCEVLYNVAEESRLKSEHWKAVASKRRPLHEHGGQEGVLQPAANLVRIWIFLEKDEDGYPESQHWEDLWGQPASAGRLVVDSVPFFAKGVARRDQVTAVVSDEGFLAVDKITERGGHSTFRVWLAEEFISSLGRVVRDLEKLGAVVEVTLQRLLAIDADPEHEPGIWDYLQEGTSRSAWELQVGYSPD